MNHVDVLYFASLREQLGVEREQLALNDDITTMHDVRKLLQQRGEQWSAVFSSSRLLMMSVNQQMAKNHSEITAGDEIAFFPPVTGG